MGVQRPALCALLALTVGCIHAQAGKSWQRTADFPFREVTATASSEQADQWPASMAIDGNTSEPESMWQTLRDGPKSAWLELGLRRARAVSGVRIYHQNNPRYYRSLDYSISCEIDGEWRAVAEVTDNKTAGWREHAFDPVETSGIRIDIARSEHGSQMGLNEVELVFAESEGPFSRLSMPHHIGSVADMGVVEFEASVPKSTSVELRTRSASGDAGRPGEWSAWSDAIADTGSVNASPIGEWVQYEATYTGASGREPVLRRVMLGSPDCVDSVLAAAVIPSASEPVALRARFRDPMDTASTPEGRVTRADGSAVLLKRGVWEDDLTYRFAPTMLGPGEGAASLRTAGAKRADGLVMLADDRLLLVGTAPVLERVRGIVDWMMENEHKAIFVEGYNERTILALYEITGEERYLNHARAWVTKLLDAQKPAGYWGTGYGDVYFADTGSALGLLVNFYKFATPDERGRIDTALQRYFDLLLVKGDSTGKPFVHEGGSVGVGYHADLDGNITSDLNKPYTIATALTGAEIFAAWHYMKGNPRDRQIAIRACDWMLDTMVGEDVRDPWAAPGMIPYIIEDWNPDGQNREWLWKRWPYDTSAYAGEGFIAAWVYVDDEPFRTGLGRRVRPHIDWLLRTQNDDGSWAVKGSGDQLRSHGVVNLLLWYYERVERDPAVAGAIQRYVSLLLDEERSRYLKVPGDGIATSLAGRALVEVIRPGVDCYRWMDEGE